MLIWIYSSLVVLMVCSAASGPAGRTRQPLTKQAQLPCGRPIPGRDSDLAALVKGIELALNIFSKAEALPIKPLEEEAKYKSWGYYILYSCPIGVNQDKSCIDSYFRVYSIKNLRIIDSLVFLCIPGGFPVTATFILVRKL
ncbi:unnamed protein product [Clonostachys rhizophaga]|uniref:Glucose-methanol-choline oxidoreductase C-terminal domain-containing protein n=1 Tax=Clonostachys rhizophaga TaxID=160324 RepID=A0A9N9VUH0_9HYPO|nr:unnamed protein product [Clonostachys rhizophaga]